MQPGVDAIDDLADSLAAGRQRLEHLLFTLGAMLQILVDQLRDVLDHRSVAGEKPGGGEILIRRSDARYSARLPPLLAGTTIVPPRLARSPQ